MRNKLLFIARHGAQSEGMLTDDGRRQMALLDGQVRKRILMLRRDQPDTSAIILTSKMPHARQSAFAIARGADIVMMDCLEADMNVSDTQLVEAREHIEFYRKHYAVVVVITHMVITHKLPRYLAEKCYRVPHELPNQPLNHGRAILFDANRNTCELVTE